METDKDPSISTGLQTTDIKQVPKVMDGFQDLSHPIDQIYEKHRYETMKCINCPVLHECSFTKKRVDKIKQAATEISQTAYEEEISMDSSSENVIRAQGKRKIWYDQNIRANLPKELEGERCVFEKKEIVRSLGKFYNAGYDFEDPRVFIILQELIGGLLNVGRINKAFTAQGVLLAKETAAGIVFYSNPLLKSRIEFSNLVLDAVKNLDQILKSDEKVKSDKDFTSFLLSELQIREKQKRQVYEEKESFDVDPYTGEIIKKEG